MVRLCFTRTGLRRLVGVQATIVNISEGGVALISRMLDAIPEHFHIAIGRMEIMIPCSRVGVSDDVMQVAFIRDLPTPFVDCMAAIPYPLALLDPLAESGYRRLLHYARDAAVKYAQLHPDLPLREAAVGPAGD